MIQSSISNNQNLINIHLALKGFDKSPIQYNTVSFSCFQILFYILELSISYCCFVLFLSPPKNEKFVTELDLDTYWPVIFALLICIFVFSLHLPIVLVPLLKFPKHSQKKKNDETPYVAYILTKNANILLMFHITS